MGEARMGQAVAQVGPRPQVVATVAGARAEHWVLVVAARAVAAKRFWVLVVVEGRPWVWAPQAIP